MLMNFTSITCSKIFHHWIDSSPLHPCTLILIGQEVEAFRLLVGGVLNLKVHDEPGWTPESQKTIGASVGRLVDCPRRSCLGILVGCCRPTVPVYGHVSLQRPTRIESGRANFARVKGDAFYLFEEAIVVLFLFHILLVVVLGNFERLCFSC